MGNFRGSRMPPLPIKLPLLFPDINSNSSLWSISCAIAFMLVGLWQPNNKYWANIVYVGSGFALIGLMGLNNGQNIDVFPAFLLIMVIRGCLSFKIPGSLIVSGISFGWFLISLFFVVQNSLNSLNIEQVPAIVTPGLKPKIIYQLYSNDEQYKALVFNMATNTTILFCLISLFVFLLVNALLSEYRSRQELGIVNMLY
jgi:hypothetical protein